MATVTRETEVTTTTETQVAKVAISNRSLDGDLNSNPDSGYQLAPFPRFRHQAVDWLGLMHRRHTAHLLMEVDITEAHRVIGEYRAGTIEPLSLMAFVTSCLAKAIGENKQMHAYRKGRTQLMIFEDVDVAVLAEYEADRDKTPALRTPHVIKAANSKSFQEIEDEMQAAKTEQSPVTLWLPFWLLLPAPVRGLIWMGLLTNPRIRRRITGTVAISAADTLGFETGIRWGLPLTAYTLSLELGGMYRKPGVAPGGAGERAEDVEMRDYLCMTISLDDDITSGAQVARFATRLKELIEVGVGVWPEVTEPASLVHPSSSAPAPNHRQAIMAIKSIHTAIFLGMGSCVGYILYSGLAGRTSRLTKLCMATLTGEALIYSRNGLRCPLADMAEDLGSEHGTVGDIFLPDWFARRIPVISSTLLAIAAASMALHRLAKGRNKDENLA